MTPSPSRWSESAVKATVDRWDLTEEEERKLLELKSRVEDIEHEKNCPADAVRFLRETHGKVKAAEKMFRKFIHWRIDMGIDTLLEDYHPDPLLKEYCPITMLDAYDKDGDAIWLERFGACDAIGIYKRFGARELTKYFLWVQELAIKGPFGQAYEANMKRAPRVTCIIDLKGMNRSHLRPALFPIYEDIITLVQNYLCGYIKKIIFIREPAIFRVGWAVGKHFFNANMQSLMVFAGSDYKNVLKEYIDDLERDLPPSVIENGRGKASAGMPHRLEGGTLPPISEAPKQRGARNSKTVFDGIQSLSKDSLDTADDTEASSISSTASSIRTTRVSTLAASDGSGGKDDNICKKKKKKSTGERCVRIRGQVLGGGYF